MEGDGEHGGGPAQSGLRLQPRGNRNERGRLPESRGRDENGATRLGEDGVRHAGVQCPSQRPAGAGVEDEPVDPQLDRADQLRRRVAPKEGGKRPGFGGEGETAWCRFLLHALCFGRPAGHAAVLVGAGSLRLPRATFHLVAGAAARFAIASSPPFSVPLQGLGPSNPTPITRSPMSSRSPPGASDRALAGPGEAGRSDRHGPGCLTEEAGQGGHRDDVSRRRPSPVHPKPPGRLPWLGRQWPARHRPHAVTVTTIRSAPFAWARTRPSSRAS